jgi:3-isopropylmalate dehydrogenase
VTDFTVAVLPGDGIGPEVTARAVRVLAAVSDLFGYRIATPEYLVGAAAVVQEGEALPARTRDAVQDADAVLLGAVGHPAFAGATGNRRPEAGLLALRKLLGAYANLRPVSLHPSLRQISPLRPERLENVDLLIVRELTGGLYYGEPRGRDQQEAVNTLRYSVSEIERVARVAFEAARQRRGNVTSVDKANVLEVSQLWRETVTRIGAEYPDVTLEHLYVDFAAMRLVSRPASFDVLLTENLFGDILSDEAAVLVGSLGLLPSASIGDGPGLFEPVHGSAPDIAGQGVANPVGAIASAAMLLRFGLELPEAADLVEQAIGDVLAAGARTRDIAVPGEPTLTTLEMGDKIALTCISAFSARSPREQATLVRASARPSSRKTSPVQS